MLVAVLVAVTDTPEITPPLGSVTVPVMVPRSLCPNSAGDSSRPVNDSTHTPTRVLLISDFPPLSFFTGDPQTKRGTTKCCEGEFAISGRGSPLPLPSRESLADGAELSREIIADSVITRNPAGRLILLGFVGQARIFGKLFFGLVLGPGDHGTRPSIPLLFGFSELLETAQLGLLFFCPS